MLEINKVHCWDCLELMKDIADKSIDLILTDPPYGIGAKFKWWKTWKMNFNEVVEMWWDFIPSKEYFDEIFRVSKNQIIRWSNYFDMLPAYRWAIIWDKKIPETFSLSMAEIAFTSFDKRTMVFRQHNAEEAKNVHPTQKPLWLFRRILENYSEKWMTILDPFLWSWTTAIACKEMWRNWIGIEKEQKYVDIANKRLDSTTIALF